MNLLSVHMSVGLFVSCP